MESDEEMWKGMIMRRTREGKQTPENERKLLFLIRCDG
jgi:hypothetical protein